MRNQTDQGAYLPTPEEIARVAAELRTKHLLAKLNDPAPKPCRQVSRRRGRPFGNGGRRGDPSSD
jgi:hypothetical protein